MICSVDRHVGSGRRRSTQNVIVQQPLVSGVVVSLQRALKPSMHIVNKVFDSNIVLLLLLTTQAATS